MAQMMNKAAIAIGGLAAAGAIWQATKGGQVDLSSVALPTNADSVVRTLGGINDSITKSTKGAEELDKGLSQNLLEGRQIWTKLTPTSSVKFSFIGEAYGPDRHIQTDSLTYLGDENPEAKEAYLEARREEDDRAGRSERDTYTFNPGGREGMLIRMDLVSNQKSGKGVGSQWMWVPVEIDNYTEIAGALKEDLKDGKLDTPVIGRYGVKDLRDCSFYEKEPAYEDIDPDFMPQRSKDGEVAVDGELNKLPVFEVRQLASKS